MHIKALNISMKLISNGDASLTKSLFKLENNDAKNADINPTINPLIKEKSKSAAIISIGGIIKRPKNNSSLLNGFFVMIGSSKDVNNEVVAIAAKAIDALAYLMAPKKVIQCIAIINPIPTNFNIRDRLNRLSLDPNEIKKNKLILAIKTRHQTRFTADRDIKSPSIAVKP